MSKRSLSHPADSPPADRFPPEESSAEPINRQSSVDGKGGDTDWSERLLARMEEEDRRHAVELIEFAKPLLEGADGSMERLRRTLNTAEILWELAVEPDEAERQAALVELSLKLPPGEIREGFFAIAEEMMARHRALFPHLHTTCPDYS